MNLLIFILACYGMTMVLVYGKIFDPVRPKYHLFKCTMCMGFWVGIFNSILINIPCNIFICGCISAGTSYFISRLVDDEGILIKLQKKE